MPTPLAALSLLLPLVLAAPFGRPLEPLGPTVPGGKTITPAQKRSMDDWKPAKVKPKRCEDAIVTVDLPATDLYPLLHVAGDSDLGETAQLSVVAKIKPTKTRLFVTVSGTAADRRARRAAARGGSVFTKSEMFFKQVPVPEGCEIASVTEPAGRIRDNRAGNAPFANVTGDGFVKSAACRAGVTGTDRGKVGCRTVTFRPIEVHFRKAAPPDCTHVVLNLPPQDLQLTQMQGNADMGLSGTTTIELESRFAAGDEGRVSLLLSGQAMTRQPFSSAKARVWREVFNTALDAPGCKVRRMTVEHLTDPTRRIERVVRVSSREAGFKFSVATPADNAVRFTPYVRTRAGDEQMRGFFQSARCVLNTPGSDRGQIGCADIRIEKVKLFLTPAPPQ